MVRLLFLVAWLAVGGAHAQQLELLTEEYPPFNMSDAQGKLVGISTDIVRELFRQAQVPYTLAVSPWMRAVYTVRKQPDHCVFSMSRLADREAQFRWVGPLAFDDWSLFARMPLAQKPKALADVKGARIGSYLGDGGVDYLRRRGFEVDGAPNDDLNPRKLLMGRIDYWASGKLSGQFRLKAQKIEGIEPVLKLERGDLYLACNLATSSERIDLLNKLLADMHKRGVVARIYAQYGYTP